jgi:hypothetical protein
MTRSGGLLTSGPVELVWTDEPLRVAPAVEADVAREWQAARVEQPRLYDGAVLAVADWDGTRLTGRFVAYRYFVARCRRRALADAVGVEPIGVAGVLRVDGAVVLGRRRSDLTHHPGMWDLIPAGGIDTSSRRDGGVIDATAQLYAELEEECGLGPADVRAIRWIGLHRDAADGVWDLCFEITASRPPRTASEHVELRTLGEAELSRFLADERGRVTPPALGVLAGCGVRPARGATR